MSGVRVSANDEEIVLEWPNKLLISFGAGGAAYAIHDGKEWIAGRYDIIDFKEAASDFNIALGGDDKIFWDSWNRAAEQTMLLKDHGVMVDELLLSLVAKAQERTK